MSKIEWTEQTWNPLAGCSIVSPGCTHCYAMRMAHRLAAIGVPHYQGLTKVVNGNPVWTGKMTLAPDKTLLEPWRRKKPTMYFVNSMSDLFHEGVPDEWIDRVFAVMSECKWHTFQVLTKRSSRMRSYMESYAAGLRQHVEIQRRIVLPISLKPIGTDGGFTTQVPPNVWLGVSAERQKEADERIPDLLATPAAVRFVSAEPLLGPIDLKQTAKDGAGGNAIYSRSQPRLDWVIVGGESGPSARWMENAWVYSLRDQCEAAGVAFFFKQWGGTNKKKAGRLLDGREWNEMPGAAA